MSYKLRINQNSQNTNPSHRLVERECTIAVCNKRIRLEGNVPAKALHGER